MAILPGLILLASSVVNNLSVSLGADYIPSSAGDELREEVPVEDRTYVHSSMPVGLKYSFSFTDPEIRNYLPGGYQGVGVSVLNIGTFEKHGISKSVSKIGYPVLLYVFQGGPFWHFNQNVSLDYEWNFGASFGWKPYSSSNQDFNLTVGSKVNAYLNLALGLSWKVSENTSIFGGLTVSHFSNGNTSWPNPGVNSFGLRMGVTYTLNPLHKPFPPLISDTIHRKKIQYDVMLWGASRKRVYKGIDPPVLLNGHFACAGISFAPMVNLGRWWRVGGSADLQWDQSSDKPHNYIEGDTSEDIKFSTPNFFRQLTFGISAHGELKMPIFAVNIGCGYNLVAPWENRGSYQNIALKTYFGAKFFINIGYQLRNFHQQSSLMLGAGITI
ncbi:MAG: acyloxyacyl hydrolase [Muribaculaceae bacterium]|nr:acyloxyacyl hydrolase [Muribaculaceae bacterium]